MRVQPIRSLLAEVEADLLAIGLFDKDLTPPASIEGTSLAETLVRLIEAKELSRSLGDVVPLLGLANSGLAARSVVVFGLGTRDKFDAGVAFSAGSALGKKLSGRPREHVAV